MNPAWRAAEGELEVRLARVRSILARSNDPLEVPLAMRFSPMTGAEWTAGWKQLVERAQRNEVHASAVLYVHIPFCARVCTYCLLSSVRTPGKDPVESYLRALSRQIREIEPVVRPLKFSSLHIGGGTPTLLSETQLDTLLTDLSRFQHAEGFQIGIEAHPATSSAGKFAVFAKHGVHRVSFGVESFTAAVLHAVNRGDQTTERVRTAVQAARDAGLSVNLDLLAGLPMESADTFAQTVREALALEPDSMSVNRFLAENSPLSSAGYSPDEAENRRADVMLTSADEIIRTVRPPRWPERPLGAPGYGTQYVWDRSDRARGYFQQDMIGPTSTLALGSGALGHIHGFAYGIAAGNPTDYVRAIERGDAPAMLASPVDPRFELAFHLADQASRGGISLRDCARMFRVDPRRVFGAELEYLVRTGLLRLEGERISKPENLSFHVTHLLSFLLHSAAELDERATRLPAPQTAAPDRRPVPRARANTVITPGDDLRVARDANLDWVGFRPESPELVTAIERAKSAGASQQLVWFDPSCGAPTSLAALATVGVTEIVLEADAQSCEPEAWSRNAGDVVEMAAATSDMRVSIAARLARNSDAGAWIAMARRLRVGRLLIDLVEDLPPAQAQVIFEASQLRGLSVEMLTSADDAALEQYRVIRAEFPPSLLWCRIAMRASKAAREGSDRLAHLEHRSV